VRAPLTRAFTLVELLVTIAVIAVLMTLVFGITGKARSEGRSLVCTSNLRQLGHALAIYMDVHQGYIPRRGQGNRKLASIDRMSDWFNCLLPELGGPPYWELVATGKRPREGEKHVLICPEARDPGHAYFLPYAMNMYLSPWIRPKPHKLDELPNPATQVFLGEGPGQYSATFPCNKPYGLVARHSGKANLLFLDAHVRAFEGTYLGCGVGDPKHPDVRWETESEGVNWEFNP